MSKTNQKLDYYSILITAKYLNTIDDYINLSKTNKDFENVIDNFNYNPIPITINDNLSQKLFNNIKYYHIYDNNNISTINSAQKIVIWNPTSIYDCLFDDKHIYKSIYIKKYDKNKIDINTLKNINYICSKAFSSINLTELVFNNLTHISENSFVNCDNLIKIDLSKSTNLKMIPKFAFNNCSNLKEIILPTSITKISNAAFNKCDNLEYINFDKCSNLNILGGLGSKHFKELIIPITVTKLYNVGFSLNLTSIKFNSNSNLLSLGKSTFNNCINLKEIELPKSITEIKTSCFEDCLKLSKINLENIKYIDDESFENCISLKSIDLKNCVKLGSSAFKNCYSLENVYFGEDSNENAENINSQKSKINIIGNCCFQYCGKLQININHKSIDYIGYEALKDTQTSNNDIVNINVNFLTDIFSVNTIKIFKISNAEHIEINFSNFLGLKLLDLTNCKKLFNISNIHNCNVETILLPNTIKSIDDFKNCSKLSNINWNELTNLNCIYSSTFSNCTSLNNIDLSNTKIHEINDKTFENCKSLDNIIFNNNIDKIGSFSFKFCNIQVIDLHENNMCVEFSDSAFENCSNLEIILLPKTAIIGNYVFMNCYNINYINTESIIDYKKSAFYNSNIQI